MKKMHLSKWLVIGIGTLIAAGCGSVLKSTRVSLDQPNPGNVPANGIPYFLPRGKIHIVATRAETPIVEPSAFASFEETVEIRHSLSNKFEGTPDAYTSNHVSFLTRKTNSVRPRIEQRYEYTVTIDRVIEPDPSALFVLRPDESGFANDQYNVKVEGGLLQSIGSTNSDQTGAIIEKLAELGIEAYKIASGGLFSTPDFKTQGFTDESPKDVPPDYPPVLNLVFNPFDAKQLAQARRQLARARLEFDFENESPSQHAGLPGYLEKSHQEVNGVFYRPSLPYRASIRTAQGPLAKEAFDLGLQRRVSEIRNEIHAQSNLLTALGRSIEATNLTTLRLRLLEKEAAEAIAATPTNPPPGTTKDKPAPATAETPAVPTAQKAGVIQKMVHLPNHAPVLGYNLGRAALVTKKSGLTFKDGCLVEVGVDKPSQVLAGVQIPLNIAKKVVALPTDLIQLKLNIQNSNNALLTAQTGQIAAQTALINALSNQLVAERLLEQLRQSTNTSGSTNGNK